MDVFKTGNTVRSSQSIPMSQLVFKYGFDILTITNSPEETKNVLVLKQRIFAKLPLNRIHTLEDFEMPYAKALQDAITEQRSD